jgi:hypothetical protein
MTFNTLLYSSLKATTKILEIRYIGGKEVRTAVQNQVKKLVRLYLRKKLGTVGPTVIPATQPLKRQR